MKIDNRELGLLAQALDAGIRERQEASKRPGTTEVCIDVDNKVIKVYEKLLARIKRLADRV